MTEIHKKLAAIFCAVTLVAWSFALRWGHAQNSEWDDGNLLLGGWLRYLGYVPNIDYRSGYTGFYDDILALFFKIFGVHYHAFEALLLVIAAVSILLTVQFCFRRYPAGWLFSIVILSYIAVTWSWSPEPGSIVQLFFLSSLCLLIGAGHIQMPKLHRGLLVAILLGLSFWFKQTGILGIFSGYSCLALGICYERGIQRKIWLIAWWAPMLALTALFVIFRYSANQPMENLLVFIPIMVFFALTHNGASWRGEPVNQSIKPAVRQVAIWTLLATFVAALSFSRYLVRGPEDLMFALREIFVFVPRAIDTHIFRLPIEISTVLKMVAICLLFHLCFARWADSPFSLGKWRIRTSEVFLPLTIWLLLRYSQAHMMLAAIVFLPFLWWQQVYRKSEDPHTFLVGWAFAAFAMHAYPYPSNEHLSVLFWWALFVALIGFPKVNQSRSTQIVMVLFAITQLLSFQRSRELNQFTVAPMSLAPFSGIKSYPAYHTFLELASEIQEKKMAGDIAFYPNFAITAFAAQSIPKTFINNFLGDENHDILRMANEIRKTRPSVVIMNPEYYPYPKNIFFPKQEMLLEQLSPLIIRKEQVGHFLWLHLK